MILFKNSNIPRNIFFEIAFSLFLFYFGDIFIINMILYSLPLSYKLKKKKKFPDIFLAIFQNRFNNFDFEGCCFG